jgi:ATP-dependent DNA helicase PIF1
MFQCVLYIYRRVFLLFFVSERHYAPEESGCAKTMQWYKTMCKSLMPHVIEAAILTECTKDEDVFILRIPMVSTDMPFDFKRLQFPVRLAFAMSIN